MEMTSQVGFVAALVKLTEQTAGRDKICRYKSSLEGELNASLSMCFAEWYSTAPGFYIG